MKMLSSLALLAVAQAAPTATPPSRPAPSTTGQILAGALPGDWQRISDDDLLVIDFADGKRATIWLASSLAPAHVANIRAIARAHWWDDATVYRVQDNYVTQWGDGTEKKTPPAGLGATPTSEYDWPATSHPTVKNPWRDAYARRTGFTLDGWAVASDRKRQWLPHCYGAVGVARNLAPDTGTGTDLYTVIGHAPRHLDRNIAVVGRVIDGMAALSALPRGTGGGLGLIEDPKQWVKFRRVAIARDLPAAERPAFDYLKPTASIFTAYLDSKANRVPPFFEVAANAADLCNLPVPVRAAPKAG